jgi:hypothetical protein
MCVVGRSGAAYLFHGHGEVFDGVLHVTSVSEAAGNEETRQDRHKVWYASCKEAKLQESHATHCHRSPKFSIVVVFHGCSRSAVSCIIIESVRQFGSASGVLTQRTYKLMCEARASLIGAMYL